MKLRVATLDDLATVMEVVAEGRRAQRLQGFVQWGEGYPDEAVICSDLGCGAARVLVCGDAVAGYAALIADDAGYAGLDDIWHHGGRYAVVHRLAVADGYRGKGFGRLFFGLLEAEALGMGIDVMRVDTGSENAVMQHLLDGLGYRNAGVQQFPWGARLAYEKLLTGRGGRDLSE